MRSKCAVGAIGFLSVCLVVCASPETKLPTAFDEYPDEPCTIKLTIRRFRLISHWELQNKPSSPANYTFWYTVMSKDENLTKVENCSDITEPSCDLTDEWADGNENFYVAIVIVQRGDATVCRCSDYIWPENAPLEPPEFEIVGFTDHINVTIEFPPVTAKVIREKLMSTSFFIKEQTKDNFRMHKHKVKNIPGNFTYVLEDLLPKTNYCVSVYFNDEHVRELRESPLKCTVLQPGQESGLSESTKVGLVTGCLIMMVCMSTVLVLKRIGYICLKDNFPNVLNFRNFLTWIFPEWPPSEAIDRLEVIPKTTKKRLWNYDYGDDSDSDEEVPKASVTGYTMHGLMGKPLQQTSDTSANLEEPPHEENSALGLIPPPKNVRMNSVNFKNVLQWEVPAFPKKNLTFTAQYESYRYFQDRCKNTASTQCDFSLLSKYGDHTVRVRAEFADEHSEWVNITFCPVDDTIIGPPEIQIESLADSLHMRFSAPQIENEPETWTMKNIYNSWAYRIQYWKNGTNEKFQVKSQYDSEVLRDLEPWTTYCIRVQGFLPNHNRTGEWSEPVCERTTSDAETTRSWIVAVILIASVLVVFLFLLGCFAVLWFIYKKTKHTFHSGTSLPQHLKEFLGHPHHSTFLLFSFPLPEETEVLDQLSIVTEQSKGGKQSPGDSCASEPPSEPGPQDLESKDENPSLPHDDPVLLTSTSEV